MRKKNKDTLQYTANVAAFSAAAYFCVYYGLRLFFTLIITMFHKNATLLNPVAVPEWFMGIANLLMSQGALAAAIFSVKAFALKGYLPKLSFKNIKKPVQWLFLPVFLGGGILCNIINALIKNAAVKWISYKTPPTFVLPTDFFALLIYFAAICVLPAILEEIFVRGYLQVMLIRWGPWFGILVSSVLFTLLHSDITSMPGIFLLSVLLGIAAYCTGSILPTIVLHLANNCIAFMLLYSEQNVDNISSSVFSAYIVMIIILAAILSAAIIIKYKYYKQLTPIPRFHDPKNRQSRFEKLVTAPFFLAVMVFLTIKAFWRIF